ncbi:hypothetical protein BH11MYX1_BH11MYX1_12460 [soil metagenome]
MQVVGLADLRIPDGHISLVRIISMLTKMIGGIRLGLRRPTPTPTPDQPN